MGGVHFLLLLQLLVVGSSQAASYKDLKFLCLECRCDREQLLSDGVIEALQVRCEENNQGGVDQRKLLLVEADFRVSPDRQIQSVDLLMDGLNLTSVDALNHLKKTESPVTYRKVSLASNWIDSLPEDFSTGLETVKFLDLSKNNLVKLEGAALGELGFLQKLNLSRNEFNQLDLNVLEHCPLLEEVDLSWNKLNRLHCEKLELKKLKKLDLSSNFLYGSAICSSVAELGTNQSVTDVTVPSVTDVTVSFPALTHLNLSRNQLDAVTEATFAGMPRLQVLDLSQNRLWSFRFEPPRALDGLELLFLDSNRIRGVAGSFASLRTLHLAQNEVEDLSKVVAKNLAWLNVSDNRLTSLESVLGVSPKIEVLDASWNYIKDVNCSEFYGTLNNLSLDGNQLVANGLNFSGLRSLKLLSMSFIPTLETFHTSSLESVFDAELMEGCAILNMSHNHELKNIIGTLSDKNICMVDLSHNKLTTLERSAFGWDKIQSMDLQGNPLDCRCSLKWMVDFLVPFLMNSSHSSLLNDLSCETPEEYKDRRLVHWFQRSDDFCNSSGVGREGRGRSISFPAVGAGAGAGAGVGAGASPAATAPRVEVGSAVSAVSSLVSEHKLFIAALLVAAIIAVVVAIGCVLFRKHKTRRRKEHIKRNRRYPTNKFGL